MQIKALFSFSMCHATASPKLLLNESASLYDIAVDRFQPHLLFFVCNYLQPFHDHFNCRSIKFQQVLKTFSGLHRSFMY